MINFPLRKLKFSGNIYFSHTKRLASAKVEKVFVTEKSYESRIVTNLSYIWILRKTFSIISI